ncbi:hypothetical protein AAC387_Pa10g0320 [Persea americana]
MARHNISSRVTTLIKRRLHPSFGHILLQDDDECKHRFNPRSPSLSRTNCFQWGQFQNADRNAVAGLDAMFVGRRGPTFSLPLGLGSSFRNYSSTMIGEGPEKIADMTDVASILTDKSVEVVAAQGPVVSEVAVAAADSFFPVAALQYFIDGIHTLTGLNWWASIALTTLFIRSATIPLLVAQIKATTKLALIKPQMEEIRQQMLDSMDPKASVEGQIRMKALFKEHGVTPFTPLKGLFIQGPVFVSFFWAITNMVEKVPSLKEGGAFWFTDLTTPDSLYIFPVLTSLAFLATVEMNMQEGMEGNPMAGTMKKFSRILAFLTVPFTMSFPKAIFCYWVTSNLFSLTYGYVIRRPPVKKFLGLPEIVPPPSNSPQPSFSLFGGSNSLFGGSKALFGDSKSATPAPSPPSIEQSNLPNRKASSSAITRQRLRQLEKSVKARKKIKKTLKSQ